MTGNLAIYFAPLAVKAFEERFSWQHIGNVYVQANLASEAIVWGLVPAIPLTLYALL